MCSLLDETMANVVQENSGISSFYSEDAKRKLISSLVKLEREKIKQEMAVNARETVHSVEQLMFCPICNAVFIEPITLPCGHTFCNFCIRDEFSCTFCYVCQSGGRDEIIALNFLLCNISSRLFPKQVHLHKIKTAAQKLILKEDYQGALNQLDTVQEVSMKLDSNYYCLRGTCNFGLGNLNLAVQDIGTAAELSPFAVHILYRKARILVKSGDNLKALLVYIRLSALQPQNTKLNQELQTSLLHLVGFTSLKETLRQSVSISMKNPDLSAEHFVEKRLLLNELDSSSEANGMGEKFKGPQTTASSERKVQNTLQSTENQSRPFSQICADEFDCKLCCSLLYKPVTSPCGHTFCDECLRRSLDFRVDCPCCRTPLTKYLAERRTNVTIVIENIIKSVFPQEYQTRKENFVREVESMQR